MIIDGPVQADDPEKTMVGAKPLRELCWELQPDTLVTRGVLPTPEQRLEGDRGAFEAHFTIGNQWQYKPTNDVYKPGTELIELLISVRSQGGTLLLAIGGPSSDGELIEPMEGRVRELGLWNFINAEAIYAVRPWHVPSEGNVTFTQARDTDTVYACVTGLEWQYGERRTIALRSVRATEGTQVEILGQSGELIEYLPDVRVKATWEQDDHGLYISATRAQRIYNWRDWPNPVVIKITHARPAAEGSGNTQDPFRV
jgi:alpha-L-fucosidase